MASIAQLIDFDQIKEFKTAEEKIETLKAIKNELIGCTDTK